MHLRATALLLVLSVLVAGCAGEAPAATGGEGANDSVVPRNMSDLKDKLGLAPDPEAPLPPEARASANVTSAVTGAPVRFMAAGSRDPQGLALSYAWSFGDGATAEGETVTHAYDAPGEQEARLVVTNAAGLSAEATVLVQVAQANRPPTAVIRILDADGQPVTKARLGQKLTLDASGSSDPDGAVSVDWEIGSDKTSHLERLVHEFHQPGVHAIRLRVLDGGGLAARAEALLPVDATYEVGGTFGIGEPTTQRHAFPLAPHASRLVVTLTFDAGLGSNDVRLVLKDPGAREVARAEGSTPAGATGTQTRVVTLDAAQLAGERTGQWEVEVTRLSGASDLTWKAVIDETYAPPASG